MRIHLIDALKACFNQIELNTSGPTGTYTDQVSCEDLVTVSYQMDVGPKYTTVQLTVTPGNDGKAFDLKVIDSSPIFFGYPDVQYLHNGTCTISLRSGQVYKLSYYWPSIQYDYNMQQPFPLAYLGLGRMRVSGMTHYDAPRHFFELPVPQVKPENSTKSWVEFTVRGINSQVTPEYLTGACLDIVNQSTREGEYPYHLVRLEGLTEKNKVIGRGKTLLPIDSNYSVTLYPAGKVFDMVRLFRHWYNLNSGIFRRLNKGDLLLLKVRLYENFSQYHIPMPIVNANARSRPEITELARRHKVWLHDIINREPATFTGWTPDEAQLLSRVLL